MFQQQYNKSQNMNKTYYKISRNQKRLIQTQCNFRSHTPQSPAYRKVPVDDSCVKSDQLKIETSLSKHYPVTTTNWCLYNSKTRQYLGVRENHQREIASLTKIMTTIVSLQLFDRYAMAKDIMIRISSTAAGQNGTSAQLKEGKYIQLYDLFYGAMLPSGNDAALLLSEIFGLLLFYESVKPESKDYSEIQSIDLTCYQSTTVFISRFLKQMNKKAKQLKMGRTSFSNPHGLSNILNVSSAKDMIILSKYCHNNLAFREIVNCEEYEANFYSEDMEKVYCVKTWSNTNKLLSLGWEGIKTGQTNTAGACLASVRDGVFIVVLNSSNRDSRFQDTMMIWEWYHSGSTASTSAQQ